MLPHFVVEIYLLSEESYCVQLTLLAVPLSENTLKI